MFTFKNYLELEKKKRTCTEEIIFASYGDIMSIKKKKIIICGKCKHSKLVKLINNVDSFQEELVADLDTILKGIIYKNVAKNYYDKNDNANAIKYCEKALECGNNGCLQLLLELQRGNVTNKQLLDLITFKAKPRNVIEVYILARVNDKNDRHFIKNHINQTRFALLCYKKVLELWPTHLYIFRNYAILADDEEILKRSAFPGNYKWNETTLCDPITCYLYVPGVIALSTWYYLRGNYDKAFSLVKNYKHYYTVKQMYIAYYRDRDLKKAAKYILMIRSENKQHDKYLIKYYESIKQYDAALELVDESEIEQKIQEYNITWQPKFHQYFPQKTRTVITMLLISKHRRDIGMAFCTKLIAIHILKFV